MGARRSRWKYLTAITQSSQVIMPIHYHTSNKQTNKQTTIIVTIYRSFKSSMFLTDCVRPPLAWTNYLRDICRLVAPLFAAQVADLMNLSLDMSAVPTQWKRASILPKPKVSTPVSPSDFHPISITPVLSRLLERIVKQRRNIRPIHNLTASSVFSSTFEGYY